MKTCLNLSIACLFVLYREIYCSCMSFSSNEALTNRSAYKNYSSTTTTTHTLYSGIKFIPKSCDALTETIFETITLTLAPNSATNADTQGQKDIITETTTVPYKTIATGWPPVCLATMVQQKSTITVFVDLPGSTVIQQKSAMSVFVGLPTSAQTTTEITTKYVGTTTIQSSCSETVFETAIVTGPASTTIFITSTIFPPIAKRVQETFFPRQVTKREVVWINVYAPAAMIVQPCSATTKTVSVTIPGQKTTVVTFITYTGSRSSSSTSPAVSSSESTSPLSSLQTKGRNFLSKSVLTNTVSSCCKSSNANANSHHKHNPSSTRTNPYNNFW